MPSYNDDEDEFYGDPSQNTPLIKDLRKQLKEAQKRAEAAEERASKAEKGLTTRTVSDVLKDKKANPALARYVLQDVTEPTPEAVEQWLNENGELFGWKPEAPAPDVQNPQGLPGGTELPPDMIAAYQQFVAQQQAGGARPDVTDPQMAQVLGAQSKDELLAFLRTQA